MDRRESDVARRELMVATCPFTLSSRVGVSLAVLSRGLAVRWVSWPRGSFALVVVAIALAGTVAATEPFAVGGETLRRARRGEDRAGRGEPARERTEAAPMLGSRAGSPVQADSYRSRGLPIL
jgi:hypothetical protein